MFLVECAVKQRFAVSQVSGVFFLLEWCSYMFKHEMKSLFFKCVLSAHIGREKGKRLLFRLEHFLVNTNLFHLHLLLIETDFLTK